MKLSEFDKQMATEQAIGLLQRSVFSLCILLETSVEEVSDNATNPYPETDQRYPAFECLKQEISILSKLQNNAE
jgi:hypothetical protein